MPAKLTPKQEMFCREYLIDLNATQAAIRAGYSRRTAGQIARQLLQKTTIAERVAKLQEKRADRLDITADRVLAELARIGFSNMQDFVKWGPHGVTLTDSEQLEADQARCVAEVSQTTSESGGSIKFKLHDKPSALVNIGKHLGMFVERHEHSGKLEVEWVKG